MIPLFKALRSVHIRIVPSCFNTHTIGDAYELTLFSIFPMSSNSCICLSISSFIFSGTRYGLEKCGLYPSIRFILCSKILHVPGWLLKTSLYFSKRSLICLPLLSLKYDKSKLLISCSESVMSALSGMFLCPRIHPPLHKQFQLTLSTPSIFLDHPHAIF